MAYSYEALKNDYAARWAAMEIRSERKGDVFAVAQRVFAGKERYLTVSGATGVPWFVIGVIHMMECGGNWRGALCNGDPYNRVTRNVPRGKGPWKSWEDAAVWALRYDDLDKIDHWSPEHLAYALEKFNGMGSRMRGVPSAYLWSFTNQHERGKFVSDGVWNAMAVSEQPGGMAILKAMMEIDPSISFDDELQAAAMEYPKADKPISLATQDHQEAHALLKDESQSYSLVANILKGLGLPATLVGGAATAGAENGLQAYAPFISFFKEYGFKLAIVIVAIIVIAESIQYIRRVRAQT